MFDFETPVCKIEGAARGITVAKELLMFHPWFTTTPFPQMTPGFFPGPMQVMAKLNPLAISPTGPMSGPFGMMPTAEQREEFSLALLADQKQQIAQTRQYFQEYLKSLQEHL